MDKKMIYNIINLPNMLKNGIMGNFRFLKNNNRHYTDYENNIYHNKLLKESLRCSQSIQIATKFYIDQDYIRFVDDNKINFYEIKEFSKYKFKKPYDDKPLLIQINRTDNSKMCLLLEDITNENYQANPNFSYQFKLFHCRDNDIVFDINDYAFTDNIFYEQQNNINSLCYLKSFASSESNSSVSKELTDLVGNEARKLLHYYFAGTYLKDILPIFETKEVKGRKPYISNINTKQKIINLPAWEHKIISIKPNVLKDMGYNKKDKNGKRLHKVRGHFRHYANGNITWIKKHTRGDASLGVIEADGYRLDLR